MRNILKVNGQYYCEPCDTYTNTYDVMQAHLSGKSHKKKTKQINRFACDLCLIEVSSQETLQTHYQGKIVIRIKWRKYCQYNSFHICCFIAP